MLEVRGDLFKFDGSAICLTTNGHVRNDGACVMGRGVAKQATERWPGIEYRIGQFISSRGNHVHRVSLWPDYAGSPKLPLVKMPKSKVVAPANWLSLQFHIFTLPVKHHWREKADLELIERSLRELVYKVDGHTPEHAATAKRDQLKRIALPRPGCGNGGLSWDNVRPLAAKILDDRFIVIERNV